LKIDFKKIYAAFLNVLSVILAAFYGLFALDTFAEKSVWYQQLIMFSLHLLPSYMIILSLMLRRNYPLIGSLGFMISGIFFTFFFGTYKSLNLFMIISFPPMLLGILFLLLIKAKKSEV